MEWSAVLLYPVAGGEPRELLRVSQPDALEAYGGITWTPDSERLIVVNNTFNSTTDRSTFKELWLLITGEKPRKLEIDVRDWRGNIRLSPDGKQIAF